MTTPAPGTQDETVRFPSLDSLRAAHTELLKSFRAAGRTPEMIAEVERFIRRGKATGALLDADADRWSAQSQLDYWSTQLYQPGYEPPDATLDEFDPQLAPELDDSLCPYVGLDAFREVNEPIFFGRGRLIDELVGELKNSRFLAVLGSSGSGKSSVVRAGLIPALKRGALPGSESWMYFPPMVPGSHPLVNLARLMMPADTELARAEEEARLYSDNSAYLPRVVKERFKNDVVLVIDQFEEVFTLCTDEGARRCFVENLIALCKASNARHRLILTMRSDFETNIARLPSLQEIFESNVVRITPLTASELREAIEAPAARIGLKFEEGVVDALLSDILGEPAALPLLQFTLLKLWERRERNRVTWESYKKLGGGREALALSADRFYNRLIPEEQVTMRRILLKMVRPGEGLEVTSNRVPRLSLYQKAEANDRIDRVLEKLIRARLVRVSEGDIAGDEQVEVAHEALVRNWPRLVEWLEEERVSLRHRQRLTAAAGEWERLDRDPSALWRGVLLEEVRRYDDLSDLESEFVAAGYDAEQAELRVLAERAAQMRRRAIMLTGALFVALLASVAALTFGFDARKNAEIAVRQFHIAETAQSQSKINAANAVENAQVAATNAAVAQTSAELARQQSEIALASRLASQSQLIIETQPSKLTVGLLLAIQSMRVNPSGEAAQILQNSLQNNLLATPLEVLTNLGGAVSDLEVSPDGRFFASANMDGVILYSNVPEGRELTRLSQNNWATSVAFSPDGRWLASGSDDGSVVIWDLQDRRERARMRHRSRVTRVAFSPDGRYVASASYDGTARLWQVDTGTQVTALQFDGPVYSLAFSPDGRRLVAVSEDRTARILHVDRREKAAGQTFEAPVYSVAFSPDGKYVVSGTGDGVVLVWDAISGQDYRQYKHDGAAYSVAFSPDGRHVLSGSADRTARIWDLASREELFRLNYDGVVSFVTFSPDGAYVAAGGEDGTARVWDSATGQELNRLPHDAWVNAAAFSRDGAYLVTGSDDGSVNIWKSVAEPELAATIHSGWVNSVAFSPDGRLVVSASADNTARVWRALSGRVSMKLPHEGAVYRAFFSADGQSLVTGSQDGTARIWSAASGAEQARMVHDGGVYSLSLSLDGRYLVSGSGDGTARVWEAATGAERARMTYQGPVYSVAISPDGRHVISGGCEIWDNREQDICAQSIVHVWQAVTGKAVLHMTHIGQVYAVAFSPDGRYAASAGEGGAVIVWDVDRGLELARLEHQGAVYSLAFSPDGELLVSGGDDAQAIVWDFVQGEQVSRLSYDAAVRTVVFSPDGHYVAAGSIDSTARVWDAATGAEIGRMRHDDWVSSVAFSPDGKYVVSGSDDGTARIWIWDPEALIETVCSRLSRNLTPQEWEVYLNELSEQSVCPNLP